MHAVLLTSDLMLISSAQGVANRHDIELKIAGDPAQAATLSEGAAAIALDLRTPALNIAVLVPQLRGLANPHAAIVGCGPHVHTAALKAAAEAGCDEVITRGQFDLRFAVLLAKLTASAAKDSSAE